ncbi:hypothetical protein RclHR1_14280010 [Rhizophagus clarus]|uniref:Uncharacterized protein n=1 Tax=Rhizophagus clarus TaxID=94130 RepID=A0A2Z6QPH4_9GLOM|nr:hypothetical protein RclHR1_14280010 [Rhizophagus clarus]
MNLYLFQLHNNKKYRHGKKLKTKKITELESQMTQQTHISTSQTIKSVKPVRQSRGPPFSLKTEESLKNYYLAEFFKNLEKEINETCDAINQLTDQFQKLNIRKCDIYGERGHIPPDSDDEKNDGDGYDEDNNRWTEYDPPVKKNRY